ncbi:MAG: putative DNA-binding domain-containing protein [Pseudohongiella sp.]|nr:putative DNA-binding domain-containing protein [Pseudohongiella sp.]
MNWQQEQQAFWDLITKPRDLRESTTTVDALMAPHRELSTVEAIGIYNNAYHQRLIQISSELYPVVYHTLGPDVYTRLWLEYIAEHPPKPGPMGMLGEQLLTFTRNHAQFGKLPALLDIIELESLLISLFDKVDENSYTREMLQALPVPDWPQAHWQAKQDWALLHSRFDLEKYWADMQQHLARDDATQHPELAERATCLLVRRVNHRMQFQRVNPAMALFLQGIQSEDNFAQLCATLAAAFPDQDIPSLSLQLLLKTIELQLLSAAVPEN